MAERRDEDAARSAAAARRGARVTLPKRFYASAEVREQPQGFAVTLDGKPVRTPGRKLLATPDRAIAEAIASEWAAQTEMIDPATMPMTRLINSALDGVVGQEAQVAADIAKYAGSDLLCYRAEGPEELAALQNAHWDPVLAWAEAQHGWRFAQAAGIMHVAQPTAAIRGVAESLESHDAFALAGLHSMTTLMGSVLLALAFAEGRLDAEAAWAAAHVDENWQISKWGEDAEARARREARWRDMQAAAALVAAAAPPPGESVR